MTQTNAVPAERTQEDPYADIGYLEGETSRNNVMAYMEEHVKLFPDRVALSWVDWDELMAWTGGLDDPLPHREITYGDFATLICQCAEGLRALGIDKGDRVVIFLPMGVGMYAAMFAVQRLGAIAVFLDSWARRDQLGATAACVKPKAMISHQRAFDLIADVMEFADMNLRIIGGPGNDGTFSAQLEQLLFQPCEAVDICGVESEFTALITFTTGSSGTPKGANRTHRFLSAQHKALKQILPYGPDDTDMPAFPIFSLNNLATGVTTIIPALNLAEPGPRDAVALVNQIRHQSIRCTTLSPSMLNGVSALCLSKKLELPSLRRVVTGGAPISRDNVRDFAQVAPNAEIWVLYGSTEVEPMAHIEAKEMLALPQNSDPEVIEEGVNVGHISDALETKCIRIVREPIDLTKTPWSELEVADGAVGEFIVTGDHVCRDYYNNDEAFRKSKIVDTDGRIWHRTGDLARCDDKGYLWMVGRIHNVIERGDHYYFPVRAEILLKRVDGVDQAAFLGLPDAGLGERTAVAVTLAAGCDPQSTCSEVQRLFAKNAIPVDSFYCVDSVPMDPRHHSKVEYSVLRKALLATNCRDWLAG